MTKSDKVDEDGVYHRPHYGSFMNMIGCLPPEDYQEYWGLYDMNRRSAEDEERLDALSTRAHQLWDEKRREPPDTWFEDLKATMWAKHNAEEKK